VGCTARAAGTDAAPFVFVNMDFNSMKLLCGPAAQ
jgi:hypothetical protein